MAGPAGRSPAALLPWPLVLNPLLCVRLVWHAYAQLRALVYAEFARFRGPHPELKLLAAQHFVASMLRTPNAHKTDQLLAALHAFQSGSEGRMIVVVLNLVDVTLLASLVLMVILN